MRTGKEVDGVKVPTPEYPCLEWDASELGARGVFTDSDFQEVQREIGRAHV